LQDAPEGLAIRSRLVICVRSGEIESIARLLARIGSGPSGFAHGGIPGWPVRPFQLMLRHFMRDQLKIDISTMAKSMFHELATGEESGSARSES
jgi:hypothetical protein